jgi:serine/threonine protein kinase
MIEEKISRNCKKIGDVVIKETRWTPGMADMGYHGFGNDLHKFTFYNEIEWLNNLSDFDRTPNLIEYDEKKLTITMNYCGENISSDNLPDDWLNQGMYILENLREYKCNHNDIKPYDILVNNGKLMLVDFGWATSFNQKIPDNWPIVLGSFFKYDIKNFNDSYSFFKSILGVISE